MELQFGKCSSLCKHVSEPVYACTICVALLPYSAHGKHQRRKELCCICLVVHMQWCDIPPVHKVPVCIQPPERGALAMSSGTRPVLAQTWYRHAPQLMQGWSIYTISRFQWRAHPHAKSAHAKAAHAYTHVHQNTHMHAHAHAHGLAVCTHHPGLKASGGAAHQSATRL